MCKKLSETHKEHIKKGMFNYFNKKGRTGTISKNGYRVITINNRREYEHRLVWKQHYGEIPKGYHIHHINGNKLDNRIENLELINLSEHEKLHAKERNFCGRKGIEPVNKTPLEIRNKIKELRKTGMYIKDICVEVGLSFPTVLKYSKEAICN